MKLIKTFAYIIFAGIISFSLVGCDFFNKSADSLKKVEETENVETETADTPKLSAAVKSTPTPLPTSGEVNLTTDYYTITIPEDIKNLYKAETVDTNDAYDLCVYDKQSISAGMEGFVFAICLYKSKSDYETAPAYDYIGTLTVDGDDTYYVSMEYATDVQYTDNTEESWRKIYKCRNDIKESIKANLSVKAVLNRSSDNDSNSASTNSGSEKNSNNANSSSNQKVTICNVCNGMGHCSYCLYGICYMCNGKGKELCGRCIGNGKCGQCGGDGYYYSGIGMTFNQYTCQSCNGSGRCSVCSGTGYQSCSTCGGDGMCNYCDGRYTCDYCGGKGYIE